MLKLGVLDTLLLLNGTTHDAESHSESIKSCLKRYDANISGRVVGATTDGAKVNYATARILETDIQRCAAHLLALLVKDICEVGHVFDAVKQCTALRNLFSKSSINNEWLRRFGSKAKLHGFLILEVVFVTCAYIQ